MGTIGWRSRRSVIEQLAASAHRFDFHQAVRLIEGLRPDARSVGDGGHPEHEALRFRSSLASAFPASDLAVVRPPRPEDPRWELAVNFMGLAGGFGPLPSPFTETLVGLTRAGDTASRDFLDIFNHRLVSLLYRIRRTHRPALTHESPDRGPHARQLYALLGLGTPSLQGRMAVPDRALLHHAGLLDQQPRSLHGLERLLASHFHVPVQVVPMQGRWLPLDDSETTRLGQRNSRLGARLDGGAVLGRRAWDQQAAVVVELGPLDAARFRAFLPDGFSWPSLTSMIEFYTQNSAIIDIRLRMYADKVPHTVLDNVSSRALCSAHGLIERPRAAAAWLGRGARLLTRPGGAAPRLGWTSWLGTRPRSAEGSPPLSPAPR